MFIYWANYESAMNPNTHKLIADERVLTAMEKDYQKMSEMFFDEPPSWDTIISSIRDFEESLK